MGSIAAAWKDRGGSRTVCNVGKLLEENDLKWMVGSGSV